MALRKLSVNHYDFVALDVENFYKGYIMCLSTSGNYAIEIRFLPEDLIVDEFFSTVPGKNFDLCIIKEVGILSRAMSFQRITGPFLIILAEGQLLQLPAE